MSKRRSGFAPEVTLPRSAWAPEQQTAFGRALPLDEFEAEADGKSSPESEGYLAKVREFFEGGKT